jgi:hypothetical protein
VDITSVIDVDIKGRLNIKRGSRVKFSWVLFTFKRCSEFLVSFVTFVLMNQLDCEEWIVNCPYGKVSSNLL